MAGDLLIDKLEKKVCKNYLDISLDRELLLNNQINFNDVFVGIILNKIPEKKIYEIYIYIKTTEKIACPFKYSLIEDEKTAKNEYFKNKKIIETTDFENIIKTLI